MKKSEENEEKNCGPSRSCQKFVCSGGGDELALLFSQGERPLLSRYRMSARREGLRLARALWGGRATIAESLYGPAQGSFAAAEAATAG